MDPFSPSLPLFFHRCSSYTRVWQLACTRLNSRCALVLCHHTVFNASISSESSFSAAPINFLRKHHHFLYGISSSLLNPSAPTVAFRPSARAPQPSFFPLKVFHPIRPYFSSSLSAPMLEITVAFVARIFLFSHQSHAFLCGGPSRQICERFLDPSSFLALRPRVFLLPFSFPPPIDRHRKRLPPHLPGFLLFF